MVLPIVIVPVLVPVPILVLDDPEVLILATPRIEVVPVRLIVSGDDPRFKVLAVLLSVAILTVLPALPVAILTVLELLPVPILTLPVVPESILTAPVVPDVRERLVVAPDVIAPVPTKPKEVAEVLIVSREGTPVKAPVVETFKPVEEIFKVPVVLPIPTLPVPVPKETVPEPLTVKFPEVCV